MSEQYYTIEQNQERKAIYWVYDEADPQLVRQMTHHPHLQGDDGTKPPCYLDQTTFWDMALSSEGSNLASVPHFLPRKHNVS